MIRTAIVGTGSMGMKYVRYISEGAVPSMKLTAAVARNENSQQEVRTIAGKDTIICSSEDELYEHADCFDAVIIATPHQFHPRMALNALNRNKHILVEKPLGVTVSQTNELLDQARKSDRVFSVVFHQRAYPKYRKVKELLEEGKIGTVYRVLMENSRYFRTEHYHHSGHWRSSWSGEGGGALINQGAHILDMWQWLFGMPESLYAQIGFGKFNPFAVDDEAVITMRYSDGKSGVFILTTGEGTHREYLEITGSKGTIILEDSKLTLRMYDQDLDVYRKTASCNAREELKETVETMDLSGPETTQPVILENFARAVEGREALIADGMSAVNSLELTNAAYLSAWRNSPVVLPIDPEQYEEELRRHQDAEKELPEQK